ncbi:MAG: heavy-metal-associated domain-containing protein [Caulobacterales bacterium]|uniref:heavy-metal-associated domain-containing protein n=1 Tax=Glycocaulis sp. TaxID=1969725 RepID=UPI003FA14D2A
MFIRTLFIALSLSVLALPSTLCAAQAQDVTLTESQITPAMREALEAGGSLVVVDVLGAVCDFCALAMTRTFERRDEVAAATVDLDAKTLTFVLREGEVMDDDTITDLIRRAGYQADGIARPEGV